MTFFGFDQCDKAEEAAKELSIHTIYVSPLRRALQTVHEIFKNHPDFDRINFVLMPKLREHLHSSNDIPVNIEEIVEQYKTIFPNFDTSMVSAYKDPLHYFIEDLQEPLRSKFLPNLKEKPGDCLNSNAFDLVASHIAEVFPERSESVRNTFERCEFVRARIKELLDSGAVGKDQKVVV